MPFETCFQLFQNLKGVGKQLYRGTYFARWGNTFKATIQRLWLNKVTRIIGQTFGNIVSQEMGGHLSRIGKTVGQGFYKTTTTTRTINGHKVVFKTTRLHSNFNPNPLLKQGIPHSLRSGALRRTQPQGLIRGKRRYQRYGTNVRRVLTIHK